jgi:hypothetical protein
MKYLLTLFLTTTLFSLMAQMGPQKTVSSSYDDYLKLESSFFIQLGRQPSCRVGGRKTPFSKTTMADVKTEVLAHTQKFPQGTVVITTAKGAKYKDLKELCEYLNGLKTVKYCLM